MSPWVLSVYSNSKIKLIKRIFNHTQHCLKWDQWVPLPINRPKEVITIFKCKPYKFKMKVDFIITIKAKQILTKDQSLLLLINLVVVNNQDLFLLLQENKRIIYKV